MDIRYLKGVGEKRAAQLAKLGISTVEDLLGFYPRDYAVSYTHLDVYKRQVVNCTAIIP